MYQMYHPEVVIPTDKYYVYVHINPLTRQIFYVGCAKGNNLRAFQFDKHRNELWKQEVLSFGGFVNIKIKIVRTFYTATKAQEYEYQLTRKLKSHGEAYCCSEHGY